MEGSRLAIKVPGGRDDHHLWNNHGIWWCHYTVHHPDYTKQRVRCSLGTSDVAVARMRRDRLLAGLDPYLPRQAA